MALGAKTIGAAALALLLAAAAASYAGTSYAQSSNTTSDKNETMIDVRNLLGDLPPDAGEEVFQTLLERPGLRLERIVSRGQTTPPGEWYDQEQDEWIMVLSGFARLRVEDASGNMRDYDLVPGDSLLLPAHRRHRVEHTDPNKPTLWLALHIWKHPR